MGVDTMLDTGAGKASEEVTVQQSQECSKGGRQVMISAPALQAARATSS